MRERPLRSTDVPGVDSASRIERTLAHRGESRCAPIANAGGIGKARPRDAAERRLALTDPALHLATDFLWQQPLTVPEELSIDEALWQMIRGGVRALLVVRNDVVSGLITSYDIQGERPLQFLSESGYRRHDEIEVGHIMTPWERVPTLDWQSLGRAQVSEVAAFFKSRAATHVVILEQKDQGTSTVRGLISRARLERQLGHSI
jgi:CBS-domain-containing membrane protein